MAAASVPSQLAVLKSITFQISSTPPQYLPRTIAHSVQNLKRCASLLAQSRSTSNASGDAGVTVHRFFTQLSALVQGRKVGERWAAAVLIKAAVDAGGYEVLSRAKHWVSGLLANLRRPDPPSLKVIYLTTLTRIFTLTWPYPSLVRELTTPSLPSFIKTVVSNLSAPTVSLDERRRALECLARLLPHHTTLFRSFSVDIKRIIVSSTNVQRNDGTGTGNLLDSRGLAATQRLQVLLHACEPKQGAMTAWEADCASTLDQLSALLDNFFLGIEDRGSSKFRQIVSGTHYGDPLQLIDLMQQVSRTCALLVSFVSTNLGSTAAFPTKRTFELIQRILSVVTGKDAASQPIFNGAFSTLR